MSTDAAGAIHTLTDSGHTGQVGTCCVVRHQSMHCQPSAHVAGCMSEWCKKCHPF
jgi:hypothetical protein